MGKAGNVLLHCHAGCTKEAILTALGLTMKDLYSNSPTKRHNLGTITLSAQKDIAYDYRDENGQLLYQNVRKEPKGFGQRRPNGDGWIWKLGDTRRVPYRLPELLESIKDGSTVCLCEGEKDADNVRSLGYAASSLKNWRREFNQYLKGCHVRIIRDHDEAGIKQAERAKEILTGSVESVEVVDPFDGEPFPKDHGKDISDWLEQGNSTKEFDALLCGASDVPMPAREKVADISSAEMTTTSNNGKNTDDRSTVGKNADIKTTKKVKAKTSKPSETQSSQLMKLAQDVELFHTPDSDAFATVSVNSHKETLSLRSRDFRDWLSFRHWKAESSMPSTQAVQDAINGLSGQARFEGKTKAVHLRVAEFEGALYLDLGNDRWDAVKVAPNGWSVVNDPPVKFRRTKGMLPLPTPEHGGDISILKEFANVSEDDWPLMLAWLVALFRPDKPFPVLVLHGEQGSGKSTTAKVLRLLIDPNKAPLRSSPKDERDLMIAAHSSWVISLDNLSSMSVALSDSICRLSTGGGFATRELHSDLDETLLSLTRPVILNGIDEVINRSDLLDRSILLHLPRLERRFDETTFWADFETERPRLLGALLDGVCVALSAIESMTAESRKNETELPRLADFTLWGMAAETGLGLAAGTFAERYKGNREGVHDLALDNDPFAEKILQFMKQRLESEWTGKPSELWEQIIKITNESVLRSRGFPKNASQIGRRLIALAPNLREHGVNYIAPDRSNRAGRNLALQRIGDIDSGTD